MFFHSCVPTNIGDERRPSRDVQLPAHFFVLGVAALRKRSTSIPFGTSATRAGGTLHVRNTN